MVVARNVELAAPGQLQRSAVRVFCEPGQGVGTCLVLDTRSRAVEDERRGVARDLAGADVEGLADQPLAALEGPGLDVLDDPAPLGTKRVPGVHRPHDLQHAERLGDPRDGRIGAAVGRAK